MQYIIAQQRKPFNSPDDLKVIQWMEGLTRRRQKRSITAWSDCIWKIKESTVIPLGTSGLSPTGVQNGMPLIRILKNPNVLWFDTAWEGVPLLIQTLSEKFPDIEFLYAYADEDLGSNVGKGIIRNGETDMTFPDNGSNDAFEIVFFVKPGLEEYLELTNEGYRWKA